jgi:AraC family transcriptional regulator
MKIKSQFDSLHGTVIKKDSIASLTLTETAYASNLNLSMHKHQLPYFCFVLAGGFSENYGKHSRVCKSSTLIFHPADETHSDSFHTETRCFNLQIDESWIKRVQGSSIEIANPAEFRGGVLSGLVARIYREFCRIDALSSLIVEGVMLEILGEMARQLSQNADSKPPLWLVQARDLLHDRFCENLSLLEIAQTVGIHETHLAREFRRYFRCTVGEYIRQLRIEFACRELSVCRSSLAEIALAAGFFDQSHFARNFKLQIGISPHEYRKSLRSR